MKVNGIYRNGRVELAQLPPGITEAAVSVICYPDVSLSALGIDAETAADLHHSFASFTDWEDPTMDAYNDYDAARRARDEGESSAAT